MFERVVGPIKGYYIASYACETGVAGEEYLGYSKLCRSHPDSYWDARAFAKVCGMRLASSPETAIDEAESAARHQIANYAAA